MARVGLFGPRETLDFRKVCRRSCPRTGRPRWGTTSPTLRMLRWKHSVLRGCTLAWLTNSRIFEGLEIGHFWDLGGPRGLGDPSERWGAKLPTFCEGLRGPRGHPDPKHYRFPILVFFKDFLNQAKVQPRGRQGSRIQARETRAAYPFLALPGDDGRCNKCLLADPSVGHGLSGVVSAWWYACVTQEGRTIIHSRTSAFACKN